VRREVGLVIPEPAVEYVYSVRSFVCVCTCMYAYVYVYVVYVCICACVCTMYVCMYVYVCVCICIMCINNVRVLPEYIHNTYHILHSTPLTFLIRMSVCTYIKELS